MNKLRKRTKKWTIKRLVRESFVLSSTSSLSSRVVRFFESGIAEPILGSVNDVEDFMKDTVSKTVSEKYDVRKNITMPIRNGIASFFSRNPFINALNSLRVYFLNISLRSMGVMFLTFAIYAAAVLLLKHYANSVFGMGTIDDLFVIAISAVTGLALTVFSEKSIITSLGSSKTVGPFLSECLGINDSAFDRYSEKPSGNAVGVSFLLGAIMGIITVFSTPAKVLLTALMVVFIITIVNAPEFGLLFSVTMFTFLSPRYLVMLVGITFVSYLLKCIRLKRNFRFGTADAVALLTIIVMLFGGMISSGSLSQGERYVICMSAVYFLAKNLICSKKLVIQAFNAVNVGACIGMALYILSEYAFMIPNDNIREAAFLMTRNVLDPDVLAFVTTISIPFVISSFSGIASKRFTWISVLLVLVSAIITDSFMFYTTACIAFFLYFAFARKAFAGAFLGALIVLPPFLSVMSAFTKSSLVTAAAKRLCDSSLGEKLYFTNFFEAFGSLFGAFTLVLFVILIVLSFQRISGSLILNSSLKNALVSGTVLSATTVAIINMLFLNPFADIRTTVIIWFLFGLCGSVYKVGRTTQYKNKEM